jgi:hypothetical protein
MQAHSASSSRSIDNGRVRFGGHDCCPELAVMATNTRRNRSISASMLAASNMSMSEFDAKASASETSPLPNPILGNSFHRSHQHA